MDTSIKHTPLPWTHKRVPIYTPIAPEGEIPVFECSFGGNGGVEWQARAKANTAFIVRAVNSHYALLEVLGKWADVIQGGDKPERLEPWAQECVSEFRQALALATKGGQ